MTRKGSLGRSTRPAVWQSGLSVAAALLMFPTVAGADVGTLTLDSLSFIAFEDEVTSTVLPLPAGSQIRFDFGTPNPDGSIPFSIPPSGVSIQPVDVPGASGQTLGYGLSDPAHGTILDASGGRIIQFSGVVEAVLAGADGFTGGAYQYSMPFTTETAAATDILGQHDIEVTGLRLVEGVWYAQIVGATTNKSNAFPSPGAAVYTVLSGQFDHFPATE